MITTTPLAKNHQHTKRDKIIAIAIKLLILSIPLSYYSISGVRVILATTAISLLLIFAIEFKPRPEQGLTAYSLSIIYCFTLSSYSGELEIFYAMLIFGALTYWHVAIPLETLLRINIDNIFKSLILTGTFLSFGVIAQYFMLTRLGIEFGKLDIRADRIGFGFIWLDYSFLSLFLSTLIPISFACKRNIYINIIYATILATGSFLTSARTGTISLLAATALVLAIYTISDTLKRKSAAKQILVSASLIIAFPIAAWAWKNLASRELSFDDNGRFFGYQKAITHIIENPYLGISFASQDYFNNITTIPHNLLIYVTLIGGIPFLLAFLIWTLAISLKIKGTENRLLQTAMITSIIGFQFVPSFFSAFYFAFLISICSIIKEKNSLEKFLGSSRNGSQKAAYKPCPSAQSFQTKQ